MVGVDVHDVVELGHRPVRPEHALSTEVNRILGAQPFEVRPMRVLLEQRRLGHVQRLQRQVVGIGQQRRVY